MRKYMFLLAPLLLAACATVSTPTSVTTVTEAVRATDLAEQGGDLAIKTTKPSAATATLINTLRGNLRAALDSISADAAAGNTVVYTTFNAALAALNAAVASQAAAASSAASN